MQACQHHYRLEHLDFNSCDALIRQSEWAGLQKLYSSLEAWCFVAFWHKFQFYSLNLSDPHSVSDGAACWSSGKWVFVCLCVRASSHDVESRAPQLQNLDGKEIPTGLLMQPF